MYFSRHLILLKIYINIAACTMYGIITVPMHFRMVHVPIIFGKTTVTFVIRVWVTFWSMFRSMFEFGFRFRSGFRYRFGSRYRSRVGSRVRSRLRFKFESMVIRWGCTAGRWCVDMTVHSGILLPW